MHDEGIRFIEYVTESMPDARLFSLFTDQPGTLFGRCARMLIPAETVVKRLSRSWEEGPLLFDDLHGSHMYVLDRAGAIPPDSPPLSLARVNERDSLRLLAYEAVARELRRCVESGIKEFVKQPTSPDGDDGGERDDEGDKGEGAGLEGAAGLHPLIEARKTCAFRGFDSIALEQVRMADASLGSGRVGYLNFTIDGSAALRSISRNDHTRRHCPLDVHYTRDRCRWEDVFPHRWASDKIELRSTGPLSYGVYYVVAIARAFVSGDDEWCTGGAFEESY